MLPEELVSMHQFEKLINELAEKLQLTMPDYEIASTLSSEYFRRKSVIWGITHNNTLVMNLPVIIVEKGTSVYSLYHIESYPIPCDVKQINDKGEDSENQAYTQIKLDHQYIAVNQDVYLLITPNQLDQCDTIEGTLFCRDLLIHTHKTSVSCLSALYWKSDMEIVSQHCEVL